MRIRNTLVALAVLGVIAAPARAETVTLDQAIEMSLHADPRIKEKEQLVHAAQALLAEVQGHGGWQMGANAFIGLAPSVDGGIFANGAQSGTVLRSDGAHLHGVTPWAHLEFTIIKPLYTFGKLENYGIAAKNGIAVEKAETRVTQADIVYDTKRAYYGYLAARETHRFLAEMNVKLKDTVASVKKNLKADRGNATPADLYALQAAQGLLGKYLAQSAAVESIALDGLKVLTGVGMNGDLQAADPHLAPASFPSAPLDALQNRALADRPEMAALEAGLQARRALVAAKKAEDWPDLYAGVAAMGNYTPGRDKLNNPYIYDPFNSYGLTPVVGVKWNISFDVNRAKVDRAQAELEALQYKKQYALTGIPFQVAEAYANAQANRKSVDELADGAAAARRWVVADLADYNAGFTSAEKVADALKNYVLLQADYLKTIYDYNMDVARLAKLTGEPR